jgi:hypothetical protein
MLDDFLNWAGANETILWWIGAASLATLLGSLLAVVVIIARMPADFFADRQHHRLAWSSRHPALRLTLAILRNTLGAVFLVAGLAMLVLPGQGLLTIFVAFVLLDFPGKLRLERWLIAKPAVRRPMDWIRHKAGREPIRPPARPSARRAPSSPR